MIKNERGFSVLDVMLAGVAGAILITGYFVAAGRQQQVVNSANQRLTAENYASELLELFRGMGTQGMQEYLISKNLELCTAINGEQSPLRDHVADLPAQSALGSTGIRSYEVRLANIKTMQINGRCGSPATAFGLNESFLVKVSVAWGSPKQSVTLSGVLDRNGCTSFANSDPLESIYLSVLGRKPNDTELSQAMSCITAGNLSASELEGAANPANSNCPGVSGLRGLPEYIRPNDNQYGHKVEAISNIFRTLVHRDPNPLELSTYVGQMSSINNTNYHSAFISRLTTVSTAIRSALAPEITAIQLVHGANGYNGRSPLPIQRLFEYLGIEKTPSPSVVNALAMGQTTLRTLAGLERGAAPYIGPGAGFLSSPHRGSSQLAQSRMEQWILMYRTLVGVAPDEATVDEYSRLMDVSDVDWPASGVSRSEWLSNDIRSSDEYASAGGCRVPPLRPLCLAKLNGGGAAWSPSTGYQITGSNPRNYSLNPAPSGDYTEEFLAFGKISNVTWAGSNFQSESLDSSTSSIYPSTSGPMGNILAPAPGSSLEVSGQVSGPGGNFSCQSSVVVAPTKQSCLVYTHTQGSHAVGPRYGGRNLALVAVYIPAPPAMALHFDSDGDAGLSLDQTYRVSDATKILYKWGGYGACYTSSGLRLGGTSNSAPSQGSGNVGGDCTSHYNSRPNVGGSWASGPGGWTYQQQWESDAPPNRNLASLYPQLTTPYSATLNPRGPNPYMMDYFIAGRDTGLGIRPPDALPKRSVNFDGRPYSFMTGSSFGSGDCLHIGTNQSPLVIDFYQEGVTFSEPNQRVEFDLEGTGVKRPYFWIGNPKNSAFVGLDRNQNGSLDGIDELFGNQTTGPDQKKESNGFLALGKHDANRDGAIDDADPVFGQLLLWFDRNQNGISEPEELQSLGMSGVKQIDLEYESIHELADNHGNYSDQRSVAVMDDDSYRKVFDVWVTGSEVEPEPVKEVSEQLATIDLLGRE